MNSFWAFALYLCLGATLLIVWPVFIHPTLPRKSKWLICLFTFVILVPIGLALYVAVGAPQLATMS
jgi:hypothetical protein